LSAPFFSPCTGTSLSPSFAAPPSFSLWSFFSIARLLRRAVHRRAFCWTLSAAHIPPDPLLPPLTHRTALCFSKSFPRFACPPLFIPADRFADHRLPNAFFCAIVLLPFLCYMGIVPLLPLIAPPTFQFVPKPLFPFRGLVSLLRPPLPPQPPWFRSPVLPLLRNFFFDRRSRLRSGFLSFSVAGITALIRNQATFSCFCPLQLFPSARLCDPPAPGFSSGFSISSPLPFIPLTAG